MLQYYFNITTIAEWCSLILAFAFLNKATGRWRLFIPFLILTICAEATGGYISYVLKRSNNSIPFNILLILTVPFFLYIFSTSETFAKTKKRIHLVITVFFLLSLLNLFFFQGFEIYNAYTEMIGDLILAVISCYFLYRMLSVEVYRNLFKDEYFWLAAGLLFSSLGSVILYLFLTPLQTFASATHINIYGYINYGVNLLLYINLIIAFSCRRKNMK